MRAVILYWFLSYGCAWDTAVFKIFKLWYAQVRIANMGFLRRVHCVTLRDKVHICEICKAPNDNPLLPRIEKSQLR